MDLFSRIGKWEIVDLLVAAVVILDLFLQKYNINSHQDVSVAIA